MASAIHPGLPQLKPPAGPLQTAWPKPAAELTRRPCSRAFMPATSVEDMGPAASWPGRTSTCAGGQAGVSVGGSMQAVAACWQRCTVQLVASNHCKTGQTSCSHIALASACQLPFARAVQQRSGLGKGRKRPPFTCCMPPAAVPGAMGPKGRRPTFTRSPCLASCGAPTSAEKPGRGGRA
jgi:hypothetical protein